jgi:hypothetical protein
MRRKKDAVGCGFRTGQMIQEVYLQAQPRDGKCIYKPRHGPDVCPRCDLEGTALDMLGTAPHGLLSTSSPAKK